MRKKTEIQIAPDILLGLLADNPPVFHLVMYLHMKKWQTRTNFITVSAETAKVDLGLSKAAFKKATARTVSMFGYPISESKTEVTFDLSKIATKANRAARKGLFENQDPQAIEKSTVKERADKEKKIRESFEKFIQWFNERLTKAGYPKNYRYTDPAYRNYISALRAKFTGQDLGVAMDNALNNDWLQSKNMEPLTPEWFLRQENINRYLNNTNEENG